MYSTLFGYLLCAKHFLSVLCVWIKLILMTAQMKDDGDWFLSSDTWTLSPNDQIIKIHYQCMFYNLNIYF